MYLNKNTSLPSTIDPKKSAKIKMFWCKIWINEKFCLILVTETTKIGGLYYGTT